MFREGHWNPSIFLSGEGNAVIFVAGFSLGGRGKQVSLPAFWGRGAAWLCFLMTLFFQHWLYGGVILADIGWPWNIFQCKDFMNVLSITMAEESKQNTLHTFPRAFMGGLQYVTCLLAPGPCEEFKINCYWKHHDWEDLGRIFCTVFLFSTQ